MEKSLDLDLTDGEYLILDTVAKDINMIQLLDKIPKNRLEKLLKYCTKHCNSYVFSNYMKYGMLKLNLPNVYVMLYSKLYNKKYNIMVYLFGENHTQENLCKTSILKELYQKLDKVPYLVDVFTEIGRNDKKKGGSYVIDQIHKFHKESKNMTNVRSHEINIRSVENIEEIYKELYSTDGVSFSIEKLKTLQEKLPKDMIDKIQKQIDNMYDPKYKKIMQSYLDSTVKALNQLREDVKKIDKKKIIMYSKDGDKIYNVMNHFVKNHSIMDAYAVSRMHRTYKQTDSDSKNCSLQARNIIYFAGIQHIKATVELLEQMDYKHLEDNEVDAMECMNLISDNLFERPL